MRKLIFSLFCLLLLCTQAGATVTIGPGATILTTNTSTTFAENMSFSALDVSGTTISFYDSFRWSNFSIITTDTSTIEISAWEMEYPAENYSYNALSSGASPITFSIGTDLPTSKYKVTVDDTQTQTATATGSTISFSWPSCLIAHDFSITLLTGTASGFTTSPAQWVNNKYGIPQIFSIDNDGTCNYTWYVDDALVCTNTTATDASYTTSSLYTGQHIIELYNDGDFLYRWYFTVSPNLSGCVPMTNVSSASINLSDYWLITQMTTYNESETLYENAERIIGAPLVYGGSDDFAGSWFYAFLFQIVIIFVYGKSKSIEVTSIVLLITSSTIIVASLTAVHFPGNFLTFIYICGVLGLVGLFYSFIGDD